MEAAIGLFPRLDVAGAVGRPVGLLGLIENGLGQVRCSVAQSQHFKRGAHFGDFPDFLKTEARDTNASAGLAGDESLGLQTPERLTHGHMTRAEFLGNMILPKPGARLKRAADNAVCKHLADP